MQWPFQAWGATAVLNGHDHTYERIVQNGFPYFVNGLGGNSIYNFGTPVSGSVLRYNGNYGAMLVTADSCQMTYQFITRLGAVIDTYTLDAVSSIPSHPASFARRAPDANEATERWMSCVVMIMMKPTTLQLCWAMQWAHRPESPRG